MTKLIVRPIVLSAPGSYRDRQTFMKAMRTLTELRESEDPMAVVNAYDQIEQLVIPRLKTDDGSPVEKALDKLSAQEFDALLSAVTFEGGKETVPPKKASSSRAGRAGTAAKSPTG